MPIGHVLMGIFIFRLNSLTHQLSTLMKISTVLLLLLAIVTGVRGDDAGAPGQRISIPVQNPSFEQDKAGLAATGWAPDAPYRHALDVGFVVANHGFEIAADGANYFNVVRGHTVTQKIASSAYAPAAGDIITLTVALGPGGGNHVGSIALTLDGTIVAKNSASTTLAPKYPNFADATVSYKITPADRHKTLGIALIDIPAGAFPTYSDVEFFDNIRLAATRGAVPSAQVMADLASNAVAPAIKGPRKGFRVFSCGHSFHFMNYNMPELLQEIARSAGFTDHEYVGDSVIFGSKVIQHWDVKDADNVAKAALKAGAVDVLTLTTVYLPDEGIEKFAQFALEYNPHIRVTIQENWLPFDANNRHHFDPPTEPRPATVDHNAATLEGLTTLHKPYWADMDTLVTSINQKLGKQVVFVVPVGQAVVALRGKVIAGQVPGVKTQEDLFADMLGHPKAVIQTLIAYCHFAVIYKKSPVGLPIPSNLAQSKISGDLNALNRLLQDLAWDAVTHHPLSGVSP